MPMALLPAPTACPLGAPLPSIRPKNGLAGIAPSCSGGRADTATVPVIGLLTLTGMGFAFVTLTLAVPEITTLPLTGTGFAAVLVMRTVSPASAWGSGETNGAEQRGRQSAQRHCGFHWDAPVCGVMRVWLEPARTAMRPPAICKSTFEHFHWALPV